MRDTRLAPPTSIFRSALSMNWAHSTQRVGVVSCFCDTGTNGGGFLSRFGPAINVPGINAAGPMFNNHIFARNVTLINNTAGVCVCVELP